MDEIDMLSEAERLLLMAAAVHELGPRTSLASANTARVVEQVLLWLGRSVEEIREGWWEEESASSRLNEDVYDVLVRMTLQFPDRAPERPGAVLFEGSGNWGVPGDPTCPAALPLFNSCRLTKHGQCIARRLLERYPEYRNKGPKNQERT